MSSTYSRASVALASALNVSALKPSHFVKSTPSAAQSSRSIGRPCHVSMTSVRSQPKPLPPMASVQLTLFAVDTPANRSVRPGSAEARRMTATSGLKCLGSSENSGPLGLLEKMLLGTSRWGSTRCCLTWKVKATKQGRSLFQLAASMPRTVAKESGLWPTPTASENTGDLAKKDLRRAKAKAKWGSKTGNGFGMSLAEKVARLELLPTPTATDYRTGYGQTQAGLKRMSHAHGKPLRDIVAQGGQLNPAWVEWLMGYPIGWTALSPSETASYLTSRKLLAKQSRQSKKG